MVMCQAYRSLQQDKKKLEEQVACLTKDLAFIIKKTDWPLYLARMSQIAPSHPAVVPIILKVPFKLGNELLKGNMFLQSFAPTYSSPMK